jgi:hypothetical protein
MKRKRDIGAFLEVGSYYTNPSYADELWDGLYLQACVELDEEFPEAPLLPNGGSFSIGLSKDMKK